MPRDSKEIEELQNKLSEDYKWRKKVSLEDRWPKWEKWAQSDFKEGTAPIGLIHPMLKTLIPQIYFRNPGVLVDSRVARYGSRAKIVEGLNNYLIKQLGFKKQARRSLRDAIMKGTGIVLHGYNSEYGLMEGFEGEKLPDMVTEEKELLEYNTDVIPGMPWTLRADPKNVLLSWGSTAPGEVRRLAFRKVRPLEDVKNDEKYTSAQRKKVEPATRDQIISGLDFSNSSEEFAIIWTVYTLRDQMVRTFALGSNGYLRKEESELISTIGRLPFSMIAWNQNDNNIWGTSECQHLHQYQLEINNVNTLYSRERRMNTLKFLYDRGALDEEQLQGMVSEIPGLGIGIDGGVTDDLIKELQGRDLTHYRMALLDIKQQANETIGLNATQMGNYTAPTKRATAQEVNAARQGSGLRNNVRRDEMADFLTETVETWNQLIFKYWKKPRLVNVTDTESPFDWVVFRGTDLQGRYTYEINPDDMQPKTHQKEQEAAIQLGPALMKLASFIPDRTDPSAILRQIMEKFPGWDATEVMGAPKPSAKNVGTLQKDGRIVSLKRMEGQQ